MGADLDSEVDPDLEVDPDSEVDQDSDLASDTLSDQNHLFMGPFAQKSYSQAVQRKEQLISRPFLPLTAKRALKTAMMALRTATKVSKTVLPMPKIVGNL